jgi:hypothetical protein
LFVKTSLSQTFSMLYVYFNILFLILFLFLGGGLMLINNIGQITESLNHKKDDTLKDSFVSLIAFGNI